MTTVLGSPAAELRRARHDAAVEEVVTGLVGVERGQLHLPRCVSEIAVTIDVIDRLLPHGLVVVLTSSQELVDHVAGCWNRARPDCAYLLTGRGHSRGDLPRDVLLASSSDIITTWVAAGTAGLRVLVGQHRHADLIGEGLSKAGGWADLVVVHEAQHTAGYAKRRAAVHDDRVLPAAARLYTTAAPRIFGRPDVSPAEPDEVALSMDEETVFGPVLYEYSAEQAITDGAAAPFRLQINASAAKAGTSQDFCTHRDSRRTIKVTLAEALTSGEAPRSSEERPCCIDSAGTLAITVLSPVVSDSDTTVTARITPVHGRTDNGWADVVRTHVGLAHVMHGLREWDPAFGRALDTARAHGLDHHRDLLRWITVEPSAASSVDDVLAAVVEIGAHEWWVGYGHLAAHHARTGTAVVPIRHKVDGYLLGQWLLVTRTTHISHGLPVDRHHALRVLGAMTDNQHDVNRRRRWEQHIATAKAFHARYGHLDVDLPGVEAPNAFRVWVSVVRRGHWPVTETERAILDALGMRWDSPFLQRRKAVSAAFVDYHARHGNLDFPDDLVVEVRGEHIRLVNWVTMFRNEDRLGILHPDVRQVLQGVGFDFDRPPDCRSPRRRRSSGPGREAGGSNWDDVFAVVKQFHDKHGNIDVPADLRATRSGGGQGTLVRPWLNNQRRRLEVGTTTTRQKGALDSVGFVWDAEEAEWLEKYRLAQRFHREHGHLAVTKPHVRDNPDWAPLLNWLRIQVKLRTARHLSDKRVSLLDLIGMLWVGRPGREYQWEQRLRQVDDFHRAHGHTHIYAQLDRTDNNERAELRKVAAWLNDQLVCARRGTLRTDRREKLTAIGIEVPTSVEAPDRSS